MTLAGHRWKYDDDMRWYYCAPLPIGGVESHQWCIGCGVIITDKELCEAGFPRPEQYSNDYVAGAYLDLLAAGKGKKLIEAGTYAAYLLEKNTRKCKRLV